MEITPEIQEAIDAAVEAATTGLKSKNTELLGELKKARKAGEITPEQLAEVEEQRDKLQSDLATAHKELKKANATVEQSTKALQTESAFTQNLLIENGLTAELTKNQITNPALLKAAIALHKSNIKVEADGDNRVAKYGDKAMADAIKEWAASDDGKHFVTAPSNNGGGATGGNGGRATNVTGKVDGTPDERAAYFANKYPDLKTS